MPDTLARDCGTGRPFKYMARRHHELPRYAPNAPRFDRHRRLYERFKKQLEELRRRRHESLMARLETTAATGERRAFLNAAREMPWARSGAEDAARVIDLAFRIGAPTVARYIYDEVAKRHTDSPALQKFARLFEPEERTARTLPANATLKANREWLKAHRTEYRGLWIAVRNGALLATSTSLDELIRRVGNTTNVLLTQA
jgi:hypothetical protein